jgi:hypothetical protein
MHTQLEFNLEDKTPDEMKLYLMQKRLDEFCLSMDKVRRKLFAELSDVKRVCADVQEENRELKKALYKLSGQREEWVYLQGDYLFELVAS